MADLGEGPTMTRTGGESLGSRVARGAVWIVGARFVIRSLGLINTLVLARLLAPEDFGLVAIGVTIMQLLQNVSDIGVAQTVVKFRHADREHYDTLFTLSAIRGLIVSAILLTAAPFAGTFYEDPRATAVFLGIAVVPLFHAFMNPRYFEFERDLDFTKEFMATAGNKIIGVVVSVAVALIFRNYWAIILGLATGAFVQMVISYILRPYRPRFRLSRFKELIGFTGWLTGLSFMAALNNKLDMLFLGKLIGPSQAGAYYVGDSVASLPSHEIATPIARAIYPGLSELQGAPERMREAYLRGVEAFGLVAMPAAFGFAFVAKDLVHLLLGEGWENAIPLVQFYTPAAGLLALFSATNGYAMAQGRTHLIFLREFFYFLVRMPIFVWASATFGLMGAVLATSCGSLFHSALCLVLYWRLSGRSPLEPLWRARRSLLGVAAMAAYFLLLRPDDIDGWPMARRLALDIPVGAGLYIAALLGGWAMEGRPPGIEASLYARARRFIAR